MNSDSGVRPRNILPIRFVCRRRRHIFVGVVVASVTVVVTLASIVVVIKINVNAPLGVAEMISSSSACHHRRRRRHQSACRTPRIGRSEFHNFRYAIARGGTVVPVLQ